MAAGDLSRALQIAQAYTWDQSHGYELGGMGYPDFDCSGFVCRCLHEAGFNVDVLQHYGTKDLDNNPMSYYHILPNAGFNMIPVTDLGNIPQLHPGDIVVLNSYDQGWNGRGGHTFFYAENISAYTDPNADSDNIGIVSRAKIEAAKVLLLQDRDASVSEIGNMIGFSDRSNFHHRFKVVTGYTPSQWRDLKVD